jgi:hypothetical protein
MKNQQSTNRLYEDFTESSTNGHEMENIARIMGVAGESHGPNAFVAKKRHCNAGCDSSAPVPLMRWITKKGAEAPFLPYFTHLT